MHTKFIFIFLLHLEGISGQNIIYRTTGQNVVLSCGSLSTSGPTCSIISWLYNRDTSATLSEVDEGKVSESSARAARLSVDTDCSLVIHNITAEDAGHYICRPGQRTDLDVRSYLSVLTVFQSPPHADPNRDDELTLQCSLFKYIKPWDCQQGSIRWVDENRSVLHGEGVGYKVFGERNCSSFLTVNSQRGHNRKYTCQVAGEENKVETEADYTAAFKGGTNNNLSETNMDSYQIYIITGAVVGAVLLLVLITAVVIKYKKRAKVKEDVQEVAQPFDEPETNLTYVTVSHANQQTSPEKMLKNEEEVTYSTVRLQ